VSLQTIIQFASFEKWFIEKNYCFSCFFLKVLEGNLNFLHEHIVYKVKTYKNFLFITLVWERFNDCPVLFLQACWWNSRYQKLQQFLTVSCNHLNKIFCFS